MEQIQIRCPTKPITHAFLQIKDNDEVNNLVRSANIFKRELRGGKIKISPAIDTEAKDSINKDSVTVKSYIHTMFFSFRAK